MNPWTIALHPLAEEELSAMPLDIRAHFTRLSELIETYGMAAMKMPHFRPIEGKLWEMRLKGRDGIARALFVAWSGQRVFVLHAFIKKTQTTPNRAINCAWDRFKETT